MYFSFNRLTNEVTKILPSINVSIHYFQNINCSVYLVATDCRLTCSQSDIL